MKLYIDVLLSVSLIGCGGAPAVEPTITAIQTSEAANTAGMTIESGRSCSKVTTIGGIPLLFIYQSVAYSTGDRHVVCEVAAPPATYSSSRLYKSTQNGATTGACIVGADLDTSTAGYWYFTSQSGTSRVVYNDPGSASNGSSVTFSSGDCSTF